METIRNFAEITESSLPFWTAQCWQWDQGVDFASLIVVQEQKRLIFGLVFHIETGSWQSGRTPLPYKKTEEELLREQPQIFELLRTNVKCLTMGYREPHQHILYQYAPQPPKIHSFVRQASEAEIQDFFASDRYIPLIFAASHLFNLEELLLGLIQFRLKKGIFDANQCNQCIDSFSLLTGNDYRRLKIFLHRLQPLLANKDHL